MLPHARSLAAWTAGLALLFAAPAPASAQARSGAADEPAATLPDDADLRRLWKRLSREQRFEAIEWFRQETRFLASFQSGLLGYVLDGQDRDPGLWPEAGEPRYYRSEEHTPTQPVARKLLPASNSRVKKLRERFFARVPEPRLDSAWVYDYGSRELRRVAPLEGPQALERAFENGLAGFPPELDLALALVERLLDDGAQQRTLTALAHSYADREGRVYEGITLYDALCSGAEIEMPDIDALGVVHDVLDDWRTWRAPVADQDGLYERIGELFADARRHRGLRHALARCYLIGAPALRDGYAANLDPLHALWDSAASTPSALAERLPSSAQWEGFLKDWLARCDAEPELLAAGRRRRATLEADAAQVRAALVTVLQAVAADK